jgi:predicted phage terminase large subunit-like protein
VLTRVEPGGSVILFMARWHPDDPAGHMIGNGWEHVNLQAIGESGALWPERWPVERLTTLREALGGEGGYEWESLYQGNPRARGARVFGDVHGYDALPTGVHITVAIGLDFAYSTRTSADYSVAVAMARIGEFFYVLDVVRVHEQPRDFRARIQLLSETHGGAPASAYAASTEMGGIEFVRDGGISINGRVAKLDKFSRAIPVAAAWNAGKILLPKSAPWLNAFVSEICGFTGVKDRHDDQIDALAAAFDELNEDGGTDWAAIDEINRSFPPVSRWGGMSGRGFG